MKQNTKDCMLILIQMGFSESKNFPNLWSDATADNMFAEDQIKIWLKDNDTPKSIGIKIFNEGCDFKVRQLKKVLNIKD